MNGNDARAAVKHVAFRAWDDLRVHWRRAPTPVENFWPLWAALASCGAAVLIFVSVNFDVAVARAAARLDFRLIGFFDYVTQLGKSNWLFALSILAIVYGLYRREREAGARRRAAWGAAWGVLASRGFYFLAVMAFSGLASQLVKHLVGRGRPRLIDLYGPYHFDLFSLKAVLASFPSGHTTTVFAALGAFVLLAPRIGPWFLLVAVPVAASRMIVGAHYPSDVCGGVLLGLGSALLVARVFARRKITFVLAHGALLPTPRGSRTIAKVLLKKPQP